MSKIQFNKHKCKNWLLGSRKQSKNTREKQCMWLSIPELVIYNKKYIYLAFVPGTELLKPLEFLKQ